MVKDKRYHAVKALLESGNIKTFDELFDILPKTVIRKDIGLNYYAFSVKINHSEKFVLQDLIRLADLIQCDPRLVIELALTSFEKNRRTKKK